MNIPIQCAEFGKKSGEFFTYDQPEFESMLPRIQVLIDFRLVGWYCSGGF